MTTYKEMIDNAVRREEDVIELIKEILLEIESVLEDAEYDMNDWEFRSARSRVEKIKEKCY